MRVSIAAIRLAAVLLATNTVLAGEHSPDANRLLRARLLIDVDTIPTKIGPYDLYTDVEDDYLLARFSEIAENLPSAFKERFQVDPGPADGEVVVLYKEEKPYRAFEAAEPSVAGARTDGYTTRGLVVLYVGDLDDFTLDVMLVHELTHLLNRRAFGLEIPTWLDEGLATELAISRLDPTSLEIQLGTFNGDDLYKPEAMVYAQSRGNDPVSGEMIGTPSVAYKDLKGGVAALTELGVVWDLPTRPSLDRLAQMSDREFIAPGLRGVHYSMSGLLVRFLLESSRKTRNGLHAYLQQAARLGEFPANTPWAYIDLRQKKLENRFRVWIRNQLFGQGIMYAYNTMMISPAQSNRNGYRSYPAGGSQSGTGGSSSTSAGGAGASVGASQTSRGSGASPPPQKGQIKN